MKLRFQKTPFLFLHFCCWAVYIGYEQLAAYVVSPAYLLSPGVVYFYFLNICLFYLQITILQRTINKEYPEYVKSAGLMALMLLIFTVLKTAGEFLMSKETGDYLGQITAFKTIIILNIIRSIFYMIAGTSYWLVLHNLRLRGTAADEQIKQLKIAGINHELEIKLSQANNAFLEQQISPHLLFNTLNFVYSTVYKQSANGGQVIYLLTEILDFSLRKNNDSGLNRLDDEIEQIRNLINLNRYRFNFELKLDLIVAGVNPSQRIIPLVLLTLVENMFVHGSFKNNSARISITVVNSGILHFSTENEISKTSKPTGRGTGLYNIRTRLAYNYHDRFELRTEEHNERFLTSLILTL